MEELKRKQLKEIISEIGNIRGRHTELVTVYVPTGTNLDKVVAQLRMEQSTAQNIKSKAVKKNVLAALEKILQHLKLYRQTPTNGLAIFCGNISDKEGVVDLELWSIEPPEPIRTKLYWCGQTFITDHLKDMVREREIYGLVVLDKSEATIGLLRGKKLEVIKNMESIVPGKTKAGGWSQARYARIREGMLNDFLKNVGEVASAKFKEQKDLQGVIIGGPGPIKEEFSEGKFLDYDLKNKILGLVDTSYTGEYGLNEALEKAEELISQASVVKEKKILDRFFEELGKDTGLAVYGLEHTIKSIESGNVELVLVSEKFDYELTHLECSCGNEKTKLLRPAEKTVQRCEKCGLMMSVKASKNILDEIMNKADSMGTKVEMISEDTPKGEQLKELGGVGAILRYKT